VDEQVLSLRDSVRVVLRCRRIVAALCLVGLVLGIGYAVASPVLYSAKAEVLLPPAPYSSSGVPSRDIQTEVDLVTTPGILIPGAKAAGVNLPLSTLQHRVSASGPTDSLIQIVAKAPNAAQAENLANSVANRFVKYTSTQNSVLESGASLEVNQELASIQKEITATKLLLTNASNQTQVSQLTTNLGNLVQEQKIWTQDQAQLEIQGSAPASGASVVQSATNATKPSVLRIPELGLIGLLGGLFVGVCAAFAIGRRDRRLRQRDEIARAAGAPVLASLTPARLTKSEDLLQVLESFQPSVSDKANLRRLLDELGVHKHGVRNDTTHAQNGAAGQNGSTASPAAVDVTAIVLAGDQKAVAAISELPAFAASLALPVALVVDGSSESTQQLSIACAARDPLDLGAPRPNLLTYASAPAKPPEGVSLTVTVEVVDPVTLDVADGGAIATASVRRQSVVLVVSTGFATPEDLEVVALAAEHQGRPLVGVVVAYPERSDKTSGQPQPRRVMGPNGPRQLAALRSTNR
jgi:capsular polysaccharide biosynthesis protein